MSPLTNHDHKPLLLVYEHRCNGRKVLGGITICTEEDLIMCISKHSDLRMVTKKIDPGSMSVYFMKSDLMTEGERLAGAVAGEEVKEEVPWKVFLGHGFEGHGLEEMVVLVPEVVAKGGKEKRKDEEKGEQESR